MRRFGILFLTLCLVSGLAAAAGYRTTVGTEPDAIPVVVVSGTPYEMGHALGTLMKPEITQFVPAFLKGAQSSDDPRYTDASLDAAWKSVEPYVSKRFVEELHGIADATGVPFETVLRAHMIPVVGNYSCSGVAVWGDATKNGHLYQIRNLDYTVDGGLQDFPMVAIYIPKDGVAHVNVSFAGVIGVNTGMNADGITLSEIGDSPQEDYPFDLNGKPFMMMFRDILYDAHNLDQAVNMIKDAKRIKKYHYVVGSGQEKKAVKMKAHAPDLQIWTDNDPKDELAPKVLKNIVYHAEGRDAVAYAHLKTYGNGQYDADGMIQLSKAIGTLGGNLLDVVYDATALELWVSYALDDECAYRRPYVHIKMKDYLDMSKPPEGVKVIETN